MIRKFKDRFVKLEADRVGVIAPADMDAGQACLTVEDDKGTEVFAFVRLEREEARQVGDALIAFADFEETAIEYDHGGVQLFPRYKVRQLIEEATGSVE